MQQNAAHFGGLDILFNNVGITRRATVLDLSEADWDRVMEAASYITGAILAVDGGGTAR